MRIFLAASSVVSLACPCLGASPVYKTHDGGGIDSHAAIRSLDADFKWFDSLDFGAVRTGMFVKLRCKPGVPSDPPYYEYGFLTGKSAGKDRVLLPDLRFGTVPSDEFVSLAPTDLKAFVEMRIRKQRTPSQMPLQLNEAFVLARACLARHMDSLAEKCIDAGKEYGWTSYPTQPGHFYGVTNAHDGIAASQVSPFLWDFKYPKLSWQDHLRAADRLVRLFGDTNIGPMAKEFQATLRSMVSPSTLPSDPIGKLVSLLPNVSVEQSKNPGRPEVFDFIDEQNSNIPAQKLANMGDQAVPQLIAALSDHRFTRSIGGDGYTYVLRVSDIAQQVLENIAGYEFGSDVVLLDHASSQDRLIKVQKWWAYRQKHGDLASLVAGLHETNSYRCGERIFGQFPDRAPTVFAHLLTEKIDPDNKWNLISTLADKKRPAAIAVLQEVARSNPDVILRVHAAECVLDFDKAFGQSALIKEFRRYSDTANRKTDVHFAERGRSMFVEPLMKCMSLPALDCLTSGLRSRPAEFRCSVIGAVDEIDLDKSDRAFSRQLERILVSELGDNDKATGEYCHGIEMPKAEIGDWAAVQLDALFPLKYPSFMRTTRKRMRSQRRRLEQVWRKARL